MKAGDLVRYTSTGDALGMGIVLGIMKVYGVQSAKVMWSGEVRFVPIRWISFEYLEVIYESR
jgi:hypothetical protein